MNSRSWLENCASVMALPTLRLASLTIRHYPGPLTRSPSSVGFDARFDCYQLWSLRITHSPLALHKIRRRLGDICASLRECDVRCCGLVIN